MLDWMRERGWDVPRSVVVPYFTQSDGRPAHGSTGRIRRLVFFGRLEPRKGIEPFIDAVNLLAEGSLEHLELVFLGRETPDWPGARVRAAFSGRPAVRFLTDLDRPAALEFLRQPGTLAVMPSLVDNSPNVVYECLEHGIPFLAGNAGGGPELVAAEDRDRTFVEPTADAIRVALEHLLAQREGAAPARPAFEPEQSVAAWRDVLATDLVRRPQPGTHGDFVMVRTDEDELDPQCVETLRRAQAASGADVVTCGVRTTHGRREEIDLFLGEPRGLGAIANYYGSVGLYRRSLLEAQPVPDVDGDREWVRLARLALDGARIVSVPKPLARTSWAPGSAANERAGAGAALAVVQAFERVDPPAVRALARLAAGLAALGPSARPPSLREQLGWVWEREGAHGLLRRGRLHAARLMGDLRGRLPRPQQSRQRPGPGSERLEHRNGQQHDGGDQGEPELAGVARGPGGLAEGLVDEGDEPQQR
jgi:hypothetical protein